MYMHPITLSACSGCGILHPCSLFSVLPLADLTANTTDEVFEVGKEKSYKCNARRSWKMATNPDLGKNGLTLKVSSFRAQAFVFKNDTTGNFGSSKC